MPRAGFEPTIPVFERAKMVHTLDRAITVIDQLMMQKNNSIYDLKASGRFALIMGQYD
jgi:hypothetical protein